MLPWDTVETACYREGDRFGINQSRKVLALELHPEARDQSSTK